MIAAHGALSPAMSWLLFSPAVVLLLWAMWVGVREWWHRDDVNPDDLVVRDLKAETRLRREAEGHVQDCRYGICACGRAHA